MSSSPLSELISRRRAAYCDLSDRIFDTPELAYAEHESVRAHTEMLRQEGFRITESPGGLSTAVLGEAGDSGPVIAILGEFDALPELGQESGVAHEQPVGGVPGVGHGCGHNLLGAGALLAASAVKDWLEQTGQPGIVRYYGCPAEEGGAAKTFMVRAGLFDDVDIAISWHPGIYTGVEQPKSLANARVDFTFSGRAAHAAESPHLGRSALDAAELMNIGVNYLREHMPTGARVHYAYLDAGGSAPNVVQHRTVIRQLIRAETLAELRDLIERVCQIAKGAALMTGTEVTHRFVTGVSNLIGNRVLEELMQARLDQAGPVPFDQADRDFASQIRASFPQAQAQSAFAFLGDGLWRDEPLCPGIAPLDRPEKGSFGSTDLGDVSWVVPTVQARVATCAAGTILPTWQMTAHGKTDLAKKGMIHAGLTMAGTAISLFEDPALISAARQEHARRLSETPYVCPIPDDVHPPITPARA